MLEGGRIGDIGIRLGSVVVAMWGLAVNAGVVVVVLLLLWYLCLAMVLVGVVIVIVGGDVWVVVVIVVVDGDVVGDGDGGHAARAHFVPFGVVGVSVVVGVGIVGDGVGGHAAAAHLVPFGVVGVNVIVEEVIVGVGVGGHAAAAHLVPFGVDGVNVVVGGEVVVGPVVVVVFVVGVSGSSGGAAGEDGGAAVHRAAARIFIFVFVVKFCAFFCRCGAAGLVISIYRRISACFLLKLKNFAVLCFCLFLSALLCFFASAFFILFAAVACSCSACLSLAVSVRNLLAADRCACNCAAVPSTSLRGSTHCILYLKQLLRCGGVSLPALRSSLRRAFFAAVASFHGSAFDAIFRPTTLNFQESLSCAILTRSSQLVP